MRGNGDGLLLAVERAGELADEDLHHDRLDHRASVDLDVAAERVDDVPARDPGDRAVNGVLRDTVPPVFDKRLPVRHRPCEVDGVVLVEGHGWIIGIRARESGVACRSVFI
jgi:hypothetical protein